MKNFVQNGINLTIPAPANTLSGEIVVVGEIVGVASNNAAEGGTLDLVTEGVFKLPKVAADAFEIGGKGYYKAADKLVTATATGNKLIGVAVVDAGAGDASAIVKLP